MKFSKFLFCCIISLAANTVFSQEISESQSVLFQQISLKEGLSNSSVFDIAQDKQGCLWLATGNGLNKYDGYKFTTYLHNRNDNNSLQDNTLWSLHNQDEYKLWIGTSKGLSLLDKTTGAFSNFPYGKKGNKMAVNKIIDWGKNRLMLATNLGLFEFEFSKGYKKLSFQPNISINTLLKLDEKTFLLGASIGFFYYYPETNTYRLVDSQFAKKNINVILRHNRRPDYIWLGTEGEGLILFDIKNNSVIQTLIERQGNKSISSNYIRSLCYDGQNKLWIGTFFGLNILDETNGIIKQFFHSDNNEGDISQNSVRSLLLDNQNGVWCGTYYGGLSYYHPTKSQFQHFYHKTGFQGLNDNILSIIMEDHQGNVLIGTNEHGVNILNPRTEEISYLTIPVDNKNSLLINSVKTLVEDADKNFWIGTNGTGLFYLTTSTRRFDRITISQNQTANSRIYSLLKDPVTGMLWIGTFSGLYLYNTKTKGISEFSINKEKPLEDYQILSLFRDSKKNIWIGTNYGFFIYNTVNQKFDSQTGERLNLSLVYCFHEDQKQRVWIGAKDGLFCYNLQQSRMDAEFSQTAFPPYSVFGIEEDSDQNLWMGTSAGLLSLNMKTQKRKIYTREDGVQSNQFSPYSSCKSRTGRMYFGGINGLTAFYPEQIKENNYSPIPIIDKLKLFNKIVLPNDETGILKKDIQLTDEIKLRPGYNVLELGFVVTNYISHGNNLFSYKLDGFDNDWHKTEKTFVNYSNLNPGHYTFHVKAENNYGVPSSGETQLSIILLPYWYQTWWAKILFIFLIFGLAGAIFRFYTGRKLMAKELELERLDKKRISELDQSKIRFFVNISHEFRTPLTLILSPVHDMLSREKNNRWLQKHLTIIEKNAERMLHLINQVLDYRKTELGAMPLQVKEGDIELFVRNCFDLFVHSATKRDMDYRFKSELTTKLLYFDSNYVERILSNLIGNAFKYTPNGGMVQLTLKMDEDKLCIEVTDNGYGISKDKFERIFDRFYQEGEFAQGTGIGLSLVKNLVEKYRGKIHLDSEVGKGSTFTVILPCKKEAFDLEEFVVLENTEFYSAKTTDAIYTSEESEIIDDEVVVEAEANTATKSILLVEDDEQISSYLKDQLSVKYKVVLAENGQIAWDIIQKAGHFDLILSDLMMPVMDGLKLCQMTKQNINFCHIPFILLTAKNEVQDQLKGLQTGADDYIGKPFVFNVLETKISNTFKHQQRVIRHYSSTLDINPTELVSNGLDEEFLAKAISFIEKQMSNTDFSVEDLCRELCQSRTGLHNKMKAITGESAGDFIRKVRLSNACKLLLEGRNNMAEISMLIGMSPAYFSTSFKKYAGCSPNEYIKNQSLERD